MYTLDEILSMEDVRYTEKLSCKACINNQDVLGFVELKNRPYKLFLNVSDKDLKEANNE